MAAKRMRVYKERRWPQRLLWALIPLAAAAAVGLFWWHDSSSRPQTRDVAVTLRFLDGTPVSGDVYGPIDTAAVPLAAWKDQKLETGADGKGILRAVAPGSYWLRAGGFLAAVDIAAHTREATVTFEPRGYDVTFRLKGPDGAPLTGAALTVYPDAAWGAAAEIAGRTDWQGTFTWKGAPAGVHRFAAQGMDAQVFAVEPGDARSVTLNRTCRPDTGGPSGRTVRILRGNGRPLAGEQAALTLYALPGGKEILLDAFTTGPDGECSIPLTPGSYTLRVAGRRIALEVPEEGEETIVLRL